MLYSIENDRLRVEINYIGAEMYSIKDKADGFEYLWQGDPQYWSGRAYNLFPICGRITEGRYTYKGGSYDICLHGFARDAAFTCVEQAAILRASSLEQMRKQGKAIRSIFACVSDIFLTAARSEPSLNLTIWVRTR